MVSANCVCMSGFLPGRTGAVTLDPAGGLSPKTTVLTLFPNLAAMPVLTMDVKDEV